jgi:hypothetical protein
LPPTCMAVVGSIMDEFNTAFRQCMPPAVQPSTPYAPSTSYAPSLLQSTAPPMMANIPTMPQSVPAVPQDGGTKWNKILAWVGVAIVSVMVVAALLRNRQTCTQPLQKLAAYTPEYRPFREELSSEPSRAVPHAAVPPAASQSMLPAMPAVPAVPAVPAMPATIAAPRADEATDDPNFTPMQLSLSS